MKRIGETVLAALAVLVVVTTVVRRDRPPAPRVTAPSPAAPGVTFPPATAAFAGSGAEKGQPPAGGTAETGTAEAIGFVKQVMEAVRNHRLTMLAAGLAYYGFFTMIPLTIAAVSIYGLIGDPDDIEQSIGQLAEVLPEPTAAFIEDQLLGLVEAPAGGLGVATAISLLITLWSASAGTKALMTGIDAVHELDPEGRGLMMRVWALVSTLALILVGALMMAAAAFLPAFLDAIGLEGSAGDIIRLVRWPVLLVLVTAGLTVLYRSSPASSVKGDGWFSLGALLATAAIVLMTMGLGLVVGFGSYSEVYGALAGLAVLMLWFFAAGLIVLVGAEMDRLLNARRRRVRATATIAQPG